MKLQTQLVAYFRFLLNGPIFSELLHLRPGPQAGPTRPGPLGGSFQRKLLGIVEAGLYCLDAISVAQPTASKH